MGVGVNAPPCSGDIREPAAGIPCNVHAHTRLRTADTRGDDPRADIQMRNFAVWRRIGSVLCSSWQSSLSRKTKKKKTQRRLCSASAVDSGGRGGGGGRAGKGKKTAQMTALSINCRSLEKDECSKNLRRAVQPNTPNSLPPPPSNPKRNSTG